MVKSMKHERFYTSGTLYQDRLSLGVGWVSHKGAYDDCLPIWNEKKDVCLVFSGEHFAEPAVANTLKRAGHQFKSGNAEYLVHAYEELGEGFFQTLNGVFSGLILDLRHGKVVLFNDRYALGRIYYHQGKEAFYFASEAKALLRVRPEIRRLDLRSWGEFFACGCALQNRTLFAGVSLLPGGSAWTFAPQSETRKETYFARDSWENLLPLPVTSYYQKLKETFVRIVPHYFAGGQPTALSLTGGLDSRMIISVAPFLPLKLQTYTFGGILRDCADVKVARQVAKVCQQYHEVLAIHRKFFNEFPSLVHKCVSFSDGCMDASGAVGLFVNRMAREIAPVRVTGNYGSEILRGHVAFKPGHLSSDLFESGFRVALQQASATYAEEKASVPLASFIAFKQVPWHHYGRLALEQSQLQIRSPYLDNEIVPLAYQMPRDAAVNKALLLQLIAEGNPDLATVRTDRGGAWLRLFPYKMRTFLEEFLPRAEYVYDYGMPQWLARVDRVLAPLHVDRLFLGQQKYAHFRLWYRDQLSGFVKEVLLDPRTLTRPYLNARVVERMVAAHTSGRGNYTTEIHKLLTSEMIERHLIEHS